MSFFDPPKFPEPFKPEPLWQMNTCPTCPNDLVCHDQGECLRPLSETERQLAEAREENARLREALADCASHLEGWHTMEALENARKLLTP